MRAAILLFLILTAATDRAKLPVTPQEAYLRPIDRQRARHLRGSEFPCQTTEIHRGFKMLTSLPIDQCVKMLPAARMSGVWIDGFEGQQFFPGRTSIPPPSFGGPQIWLDASRTKLGHGFMVKNGPPSRAHVLDIIGRRTRYPGSYGHMGVFQHEIIVDRLISAHRLAYP